MLLMKNRPVFLDYICQLMSAKWWKQVEKYILKTWKMSIYR